MNEVIKNMEERRSVRGYKPDMIRKEDLDTIIEAGTYAATGMGMQSPIIVAVTDKATRDQLSAMNAKIMGTDTDPFYGAPVDKAFIPFALYKDRTQVIHEIFLHFMIMLYCNPSEAVSDEPVAEYLMQITFQWAERCNDLLLCTELFNLIFAFFLFLLQIFIICTCISHKFKHIVQTER